MSTDSVTTGPLTLPPRAVIAGLTLQLRDALQGAAVAEQREAAIDHEAAVSQLRARLTPQIEARRQALDEAVAKARAEAAAAVSDARRGVTGMVRWAPAPIDLVASPVAQEEIVTVVDPSADRPAVQNQPQINLVIEADAFARVFATVLGEHLSALGLGSASSQPPARPKQSLWSHARHLDVVLVGVATLIVLAIVAAWLG